MSISACGFATDTIRRGTGALVMKEVMLPICSPPIATRTARTGRSRPTPSSASPIPPAIGCGYPSFLTRRSGPAKSLSFSDYAVVVQAALLGQGIALGWLTVAAHCC